MVAAALVTANMLLALQEDDLRRELIEGELITMSPAGFGHSWIVARVVYRLTAFVEPRGLGLVTESSGGYFFHHDPDTVLAPDVAFIRAERATLAELFEGFSNVVPDWVAEVRSPSERAGHLKRKIGIYLAAGVRMVVIVDPADRSVTVHRPHQTPRRLVDGDLFDGEDVIPGFQMAVEDFFPPR